MKLRRDGIDITNDTMVKSLDNIHQELLHVLSQIYYTFVRIDLRQNLAYFIQCRKYPEALGYPFNWEEYLELTSSVYLPDEKERVLKGLSCSHLIELCENNEQFYTMDVLYLKNGSLSSMKIMALLEYDGDIPVAYISTRNSSADCLRNHIINTYVYNDCDYFCYVDAKHNSYKMFSTADNGTPLPPVQSNNYSADMVAQAEKFVVPEDQDFVISEMRLERVLSQLEKTDSHSFYYGVMDPVRGYTRKRLEYRYYERNTQMVLLSRTDVTDIYLEEETKRKALTEALKRAETDGLTGLLNYQGLTENVSSMLEQDSMQAALLFIDLDNFKQVNDTLGHAMGDTALREVAAVLKQSSFGAPLVGRVGGDEFVVFFPHAGSMKEVTGYARYLCDTISQLSYSDGEKQVHISCSVGISTAPKDGTTYKELVKKADQMTYYIKERGKNGYAVYGETE